MLLGGRLSETLLEPVPQLLCCLFAERSEARERRVLLHELHKGYVVR